MLTVEHWPLERLIPYARNPRKNDQAVDRMCAVIREFGSPQRIGKAHLTDQSTELICPGE